MGLKLQTEIYNTPLDQIFAKAKTDADSGLSEEQVSASFELYGRNLIEKKKISLWKVIIAPIINLLIIIYLISAFAMWALGEVERTTPTFIIVGLNTIIAIIQQLRAEKKLDALQKLSIAHCTVVRDGKEVEIKTTEIAVGDIVLLRQGDKVPADCRLIEAVNLSIDEASLTGESEPVKKVDGDLLLGDGDIPLHDQKNMAFLGTFVSSGFGKGVVVQVGPETEIGQISSKLEASTTGEIPLRRKMNQFAKYLGLGVLTLLIISIIHKSYLLSVLPGYELTLDTFRLALIDSIDLGMKVMPINLPLLTSIVLLTGVVAMAHKGVIVREISRTESLGRVSVVCSDKTGTLTKNEMTALYIWTLGREYEVSGRGYSPVGEISPIGDTNTIENSVLEKLILSGYLNNNCKLIREMVETATKEGEAEKWVIKGLPTEASLKVLAKKYPIDLTQVEEAYKFIYEFSFDSSIKRMSTVFRYNESPILFTKGATEWLLPLCSRALDGEGNKVDLSEQRKTNILDNMMRYASEGYRVLSIAYRPLEVEMLTKIGQEDVRGDFEQDLTYLGFVVILDPPREDVKQAVAECESASVKVIMITGDSLPTAKAIGSQLDIFRPGNLALEGKLLSELGDEEFLNTTVYARVSPEHKEIIVRRYQDMNRIVAMTGDGVNDALALSLADCGLAMGVTGTEVAKQAADMVITDDAFGTIVTGLEEGRGLFMKIRNVIYFFICISVMESIIFFSSTFLHTDPYYEMFDYWQLNLLYVTAHMFPSLGFTFGNNSKYIMQEEPRNTAEIISKDIFLLMIVHMVLMGLGIVLAYYLTDYGIIGLSEFNLEGIVHVTETVSAEKSKARTMAFVVLFILISFCLPLQIRRMNYSVFDSLRDMDYLREFIFYIPSVLLLIGAIYNVEVQFFMAEVINWPLNFMFLDLRDWLICIALCLPGSVGFELVRLYCRKKGITF